MKKIAICDDNQESAKKLYEICSSYCRKECWRTEIFVFSNSIEFLKDHSRFEVIFMDIDMPGMSGIEATKIMREYNKESAIIFVSAYSNYKSIAFSIHPFDYIDKPYTDAQICHVLNEVRAYLDNSPLGMSIMVKSKGETTVIPIATIRYIELVNRKIMIHVGNDIISTYDNIANLYSMLSDKGFLRPHNSFLVNYRYIKQFARYTILLVGNQEIPIAQSRYKKFEQEFHSFLMKQGECYIC